MKKRMHALPRRFMALLLACLMLTGSAFAVTFSDIGSHWAKKYIVDLAGQGMIKGYEDGTFKPQGLVSNLETLVFASRILKANASATSAVAALWGPYLNGTIDSAYAWAKPELALCLETGIITRPELEAICKAKALGSSAQKEDLAVWLVRAMQLEPMASSLKTYVLTFNDSSTITSAAKPYVYLLNKTGVVEGDEKNQFAPKSSVTRAVVTTMLSRALAYMSQNGIVPEVPNQTSYSYTSGVLAGFSAVGSVYQLSLTDVTDHTEVVEVPLGIKIYEDGVLGSAADLAAGSFARIRYDSAGKAVQLHLTSSGKTITGTVTDLTRGSITIRSAEGVSTVITLDRFTQVLLGNKKVTRDEINLNASYTSAICLTNGSSRAAALKLFGGSRQQQGLVQKIENNTIYLKGFDGTLSRYTVAPTAKVTVDGITSSLSASLNNAFATLQISYDSGNVVAVTVNTTASYVQGTYTQSAAYDSYTVLTYTDLLTGNTMSRTLETSCPITYEGKTVKLAELPRGSMITMKLASRGTNIAAIDGFAGNSTATGTVASLTFGETILLEVKGADAASSLYLLNPSRLPTVYRDGVISSIDKINQTDPITVIVKAGVISSISTQSQTTVLSGTVARVSYDTAGSLIYLTDAKGTTTSYPLASGVSVTYNGGAIGLTSLIGGQVKATLSGGQITAIELTQQTPGSATTELTGTVLFVNTTDRTVLMSVPSSGGAATQVTVAVPTTAKLITSGGSTASILDLKVGNTLQVFGGYNGSQFKSTLIIIR